MPGLRKARIVKRIRHALQMSGAQILAATYSDGKQILPWRCNIEFPDGSRRAYNIYVWTVSHGGKTRSLEEYRIQTTLRTERHLRVEAGTTLLLGYYRETVDQAGREVGNQPPEGMEVFVAWDALHHLRLGESSSCQVPFPLMYEAYLKGRAHGTRKLRSGTEESIFALRPEYLSSYMQLAAGCHERVAVGALRAAY